MGKKNKKQAVKVTPEQPQSKVMSLGEAVVLLSNELDDERLRSDSYRDIMIDLLDEKVNSKVHQQRQQRAAAAVNAMPQVSDEIH